MSSELSPAGAVAISVACAVPGLFTTFLPSVFAVGEEDRDQVRRGQARAAVASLALGAAASATTRSPWPVLTVAAVAALIIWQYETQHTRGTLT